MADSETSGDAPITTLVEVTFRPEVREEGWAALAESLQSTRVFPGLVSAEIFQDSADPCRAVLVERWESLAADQAYRAWRKTPEGASRTQDYIAAPHRITFLEPRPDI